MGGLASKTILAQSENLPLFPSMKQTFGIVDNGTVRDMTPEEIEYYSSLREDGESVEEHAKRVERQKKTDVSPSNL